MVPAYDQETDGDRREPTWVHTRRSSRATWLRRFAVATLFLLLASQQAFALDSRPGKADAAAPPGPVRAGYFSDDLKDANGEFIIHYALDTPTQLPKKRELGLIIALHGNGHQAEEHAKSWKGVVTLGKLDQEYIVLALKSRIHSWTQVDEPLITKAIDWVLATYPIDRRRVHLAGFSAGAAYTLNYGSRHQERFATLSAYCAGRDVGVPLGGRDLAPGIYLHFGGADGALPPNHGQGTRDVVQAAGYRYVCRIPIGVGHDYGPAGTVLLDNLRWMHQSRSRHVPLEPEQNEFVQKALKDAKSAEGIWTDPALATQALSIGGHYAQTIALKASKAKSEAVRINIAKAAANGLFGAEMLLALGENLADKSTKVRKESIAALAPAANWNWPEAKTLLAQFATDKKNAVDERCAATQALVDATVMIALAEKYDDNVIVPTLVKLLDSPDQAVRTVAFTGLSRITTQTFGYDPSAKERKKALEGWLTWLNGKCGSYKEAALTK